MWTRAELKQRAKTALKPYYWWGVLACLIAGLLGAGSEGSGISFGSFGSNGFSGLNQNGNYSSGSFEFDQETIAILLGILGIVAVITVLAIIFSLFVSTVIYIGKLKFFLDSRYQGSSAGMGTLFSGFSSGHYLNLVKTMFLKGLYEFLWSLLLIVPGIIKHYEYYMVPYLLAENPELDCKDAFRISKEMMDGNKFRTWVLELSFTGWYLLAVLTCGIGIFFLNPYYQATFAELYLQLKKLKLGVSQPDSSYVK